MSSVVGLGISPLVRIGDENLEYLGVDIFSANIGFAELVLDG